MLSKNLDLVKNKPTITTHYYYTKQPPIVKPAAFTDQTQDVEFHVQTKRKPVKLSECDLCFEVTATLPPEAGQVHSDSNVLFNALRGPIEGLKLTSGTDQLVYDVSQYVWAYAQIVEMQNDESHVNKKGYVYEGPTYQGNVGIVSIGLAQQSSSHSIRKDSGLFVPDLRLGALNPVAPNVQRKFQIIVPMKKFGGIFREDTAIIPFVDDILYFKFTLVTKNSCFQRTDGVDTFNIDDDVTINDMYLNVARSRDPFINKSLVDQSESGVTFPYLVVRSKHNIASGDTNFSFSHSLTSDFGQRIRAVDTCMINGNLAINGIIADNADRDAGQLLNLSGFIGRRTARNLQNIKIEFDGEIIMEGHPFLNMRQGNIDDQQLLGRMHTHCSLTDDESMLDTGFELGSLPSTNYICSYKFADGQNTPNNTRLVHFFTGVKYITMNKLSIKTTGDPKIQ